jgi:hypothetical protein
VSLNHAYLGVRNAELQVRDGPDSGHAADMSKTTRMTQCGPLLCKDRKASPHWPFWNVQAALRKTGGQRVLFEIARARARPMQS